MRKHKEGESAIRRFATKARDRVLIPALLGIATGAYADAFVLTVMGNRPDILKNQVEALMHFDRAPLKDPATAAMTAVALLGSLIISATMSRVIYNVQHDGGVGDF